MEKVYIFLADGFEEIEGLTVVDLLRRVNISISMVSITGDQYVTGSHQITVKTDALFNELDYADASMLVLPGGMPGTKNLAAHTGLTKLLKDFSSKGKKLSAICAAPSVLGELGLLQGKKATCYPGFESALHGAEAINTAVVSDGNFITSRGMGTAIDFALAIISNLAGEAQAAQLAGQIQYHNFQ